MDLDGRHFAILDEQSINKNVLVCKIGDKHLKGDSLDSRRLEGGKCACTLLMGIGFGDWEDQKGQQQR